jgi:hypothetical protein
VKLATLVLAALPLLAADASFGQSRGDYRNGEYRGRRERFNRGDRAERDAPSQPPAPEAGVATTGPAGAMQDQFKVLLERSIFARSGVAAPSGRPSTTSTAPAAPPLSPEQAVVFVGVLVQDNEYVAFAENQQTRQLMVLRAGDDVARGKVVGMTLDTLAYGSAGAIKVVHLGQNLAGELAPTSSFATDSTSTTGPSAGTPPAGMSPDQAAVLERLRARARQQRGE